MPTTESTPAVAHVPLAEVRRGGIVESVHRGSIAVCDEHGRLLFSAGDPASMTFTRSALKPLQALPFVAAGGVERYGYSPAQVALMCGSHAGETHHVEAAADMLARAGNTADELQCGTHVPYRFDARGEPPPPPPYSPLANNCSGKHSGMLAYCSMCGHDKRDYLALDHPPGRQPVQWRPRRQPCSGYRRLLGSQLCNAAGMPCRCLRAPGRRHR